MKVVILAGGFGTRFSEETEIRPKPMIEIGDKPILWHIMKIYSSYGFNDFIICLGYKGSHIKQWFANYYVNNNDITLNLRDNSLKVHKNHQENWNVTLVDTGQLTLTAGRIRRIQKYVHNESFMATYGDGVGDVNINELIECHQQHRKIATLTAIIPEGRFGTLDLGEKNRVNKFSEKTDNKSRVNGGFFVFEPEIFKYLTSDQEMLERQPFERLAEDGQLYSFLHDGFWKPMDKLIDKKDLEKLWQSGNAPWKVWGDNDDFNSGKNEKVPEQENINKPRW